LGRERGGGDRGRVEGGRVKESGREKVREEEREIGSELERGNE
jgi:hypothetical protein